MMMGSIATNPTTPTRNRHFRPRFRETATSGFTMGAIYGTTVHLIKGIYNSPNGHRLSGGLESMRFNAPRSACTFAAFRLILEATFCSVSNLQQKQDKFTPYISIAAATGIFKIRSGIVTASKWAVSAPFAYALFIAATDAMFPKPPPTARRLRRNPMMSSDTPKKGPTPSSDTPKEGSTPSSDTPNKEQ